MAFKFDFQGRCGRALLSAFDLVLLFEGERDH